MLFASDYVNFGAAVQIDLFVALLGVCGFSRHSLIQLTNEAIDCESRCVLSSNDLVSRNCLSSMPATLTMLGFKR